MFLTVLLLLRSSPLPILPEVSGEMNDDDDDDSDEAAENKDGTATATDGASCFLLECCIIH